jgi:RimJ/RimL family protein N-acetyltransferase
MTEDTIPKMILETDRLILREFKLEDARPMEAVLGDPDVMEFSEGVMDTEGVATWLKFAKEGYARRGYGPWAIIEKSSEAVIGYCGLFHFPDINGREEIEIGYRLARKQWGKGYATEAALAVRDNAFNSLGMRRLICMVDPHNTRSVRVAEKLGMTKQGEVKLHESWTHADHVYVIKKS